MKIHLVTYDLYRPGQNYASLFEALESYAGGKALLSTWVIATDQSAGQVFDHLAKHIDSTDKLLIVTLNGQAAWYGLSDAWTAWLQTQLAQAA